MCSNTRCRTGHCLRVERCLRAGHRPRVAAACPKFESLGVRKLRGSPERRPQLRKMRSRPWSLRCPRARWTLPLSRRPEPWRSRRQVRSPEWTSLPRWRYAATALWSARLTCCWNDSLSRRCGSSGRSRPCCGARSWMAGLFSQQSGIVGSPSRFLPTQSHTTSLCIGKAVRAHRSPHWLTSAKSCLCRSTESFRAC